MKNFKKISSLCLFLVLLFTLVFMTSCTKKQDIVKEDEIETQARPIELKMMRLANTTQDVVVVTASVNPNNVINDKLTWDLSWATTSSDAISDYVTMVVSQDTHSVTLTYKKNFNRQILLKATSVLTSSISATCTIDCYKRTTNFSLDFAFDSTSGDDLIPDINESQKTIDFSGMTYTGLSEFSICDFDLMSPVQSGTVNVTNKKSVKFSLSSELKTKLTSAGITFKQEYAEADLTNYQGMSIDTLLNKLITITSANREQVYKILGTVNHWFDMTCEIKDMNGTTEVNSFTKVYKMQGFNISDGLAVTSVTLNKTNIVF